MTWSTSNPITIGNPTKKSDYDLLWGNTSHVYTAFDVEHNSMSGVHHMAAGSTVGDLFYHDGTNLVRLAKGTVGQVLRQNSALTAPEWVTIFEAKWTPTVGTFTATPASTSTLTMTTDLTASILVGMGLRYVIGGTAYYGRASAITANLLTVNGAPLGGDVTALAYGGTVRQVMVIIPGPYEDASSSTLIVSDLKSSLVWSLQKSYCVYYRVYSDTVDSGTKGKASVYVNAAEVNSSAGGLTLTAAKTWYSTVVNINTANYDINEGEAIEITSTKNGNGDANDLTVTMIFVTP